MVSKVRTFKLNALPSQWVPDAVYYVKTGNMVAAYVTDDFGNPLQVSVTDGSLAGALLIANRLSELDTPEAKVAARQNLELQDIDGGTFN
jgi:hypothetical protein